MTSVGIVSMEWGGQRSGCSGYRDEWGEEEVLLEEIVLGYLRIRCIYI